MAGLNGYGRKIIGDNMKYRHIVQYIRAAQEMKANNLDLYLPNFNFDSSDFDFRFTHRRIYGVRNFPARLRLPRGMPPLSYTLQTKDTPAHTLYRIITIEIIILSALSISIYQNIYYHPISI